MNQEILNFIESLPPLPDSIIKLNAVRAQNEYKISEVVDVIKTDPNLSVKVLKYLNSSAFPLKNHVSDIYQAIMLLGEEIVVALAFVEATKTLFTFDLSPYAMNETDFYHRANAQLVMMSHWSKKVQYRHKKLLPSAIFLSDFGKLILSQIIIKKNNTQLMQEKIEIGISLDIAEKECSGYTSSFISASMLRHWKFDSQLTDLIEFSDEPILIDESLRKEAAMMQSVKNSISLQGEMISNDSFQNLLLQSYNLSHSDYDESWNEAKKWLESN